MKIGFQVLLIALILPVGLFLAGRAYGQSTGMARSVKTGRFNCSPAPCTLPPTQASERGSTVTDSPIVADPQNEKHLLLGSVDFNCSEYGSSVGFHLSSDGGSNWKRHCMPVLVHKGREYLPDFDPLVGYDRNGVAYIVGDYDDSKGFGYGFVGFQKSTDGTHWSKPGVALGNPGRTYPFETSFTVDTNLGSPRVNSLYVSGVMWMHQGYWKQVLVSHSTDGGATWTQSAVDSVQKSPAEDDLTRMAVGQDGTVYVAWMHCASACRTAQVMFSKSADGGNTWSSPQRIATVKMPLDWALPNTGQRAYNYPVIDVDNSNGKHAGNLYVATYTWTGTFLRVQVIRSADGGATWSRPVPVAPASDSHDQFFPSLSVSPTGNVGVSWLDRRNDPANHNYQAFAAISTDGGRTFPNTQLTQAFSDPDTNGTGNNWMGDYTGNTWAGEKFIAAWMDSSNGIDMQEVVGGIRLK